VPVLLALLCTGNMTGEGGIMALEGLKLGHYQLLYLIGSGGMGEVYLAEDARLYRQVAIKVIRSEVSSYPNAVANQDAARLFQREAKAIAMLDHPHILPLFDFGEEFVNGSQYTYLVMPFRQEGSLANWLHQRSDANLLSVGDVEHLIRQAADALQYAHNHQIIHQDVKPSNFLIRGNPANSDRPDLLLTDFGVAKLSTATSSVSHSVRGTPTYMAPEQWSGNAVVATDQYALAVMAYELLTGRPPFQGSPLQMMYLHTQQQPQPPSSLNPQIPVDMDTVLLCALSKSPEARFASISAFANAFSQALQSVGSPTIINTQHWPVSNDLRVTLAISEIEALQGTQRRLTLPGGRQVVVSVPANAYHGQIIRLDSLGESVGIPGSAGALILTLNVKHAAEAFPSSSPGNIDLTVPASNPNLSRDEGVTRLQYQSNLTLPASNPNLSRTIQVPDQPRIQQPVKQKSFARGRFLVPLILVILLILGSGSFLLYTSAKNQQTGNTGNTATPGGPNTGATAQANTATALANANAIAQANATATAQAIIQGTSQANGIATAEANATATANSGNNNPSPSPNPYPPYSGTLGLNDPLRDNSQGNNWQTYQDSLSACQFTGGAYDALETKNAFYADCFSDPYFSNFTLQVQMQILQGDCGGIMFRADATHTQFYYFRICQDGSYILYRYIDNKNSDAQTLASGNSSAISSSQVNTIAVVANSNQISLYANQTFLASAVDSNYSNGHIGIAAQSQGNQTEVAFSNMKIWVF
jgi:eukaryotic-like serine/threonine-protein kinase